MIAHLCRRSSDDHPLLRQAGTASLAGVGTALALSLAVGYGYTPTQFPAAMRAIATTLGPQVLCATDATERPRPSTTIISSRALPDVPGKRITAMLVDFAPGAYSPEHHHEASLYVHVLKGTIRSQLSGEPVGTFKAGESFHEPIGAVHLFSENTSASEPAQVLAVFVHDEG